MNTLVVKKAVKKEFFGIEVFDKKFFRWYIINVIFYSLSSFQKRSKKTTFYKENNTKSCYKL